MKIYTFGILIGAAAVAYAIYENHKAGTKAAQVRIKGTDGNAYTLTNQSDGTIKDQIGHVWL